jgi:uncharacterized sulfatase
MTKHLLYLVIVIFFYSCNNGSRKKPNVVFILADDLGWSQVGCYGSNYYQTPNIDGLAEEGIRFTSAYAAAPVCSPTRASIMTGKHPARLHLTNFIPGNAFKDSLLAIPDWQKHLPLDEVTIGELARSAGYATALYGKWHLSSHKTPPESHPFNPDKQGFESTFVTYKPVNGMAKPWQTAEHDAHNVDTITSLALHFIEENKTNPFLLVVSHNTIHDPLMEKHELISKYKNMDGVKRPENHPVIAAMIETLDNSVGRILQKLEEANLKENTLVIFYSDNGGKKGYAAQTPFRAGKGWLYEGGIRVPLIMRWPGYIETNAVNSEFIISNDFYPTFHSIFGLGEINETIDGLDIMSIINDDKADVRNTLFWHYPHYHKGSGMKPAGAIRKNNYKLIEWYEDRLTGQKEYYELYDLSSDPGETQNVADSLTDTANELINDLKEWRLNVNTQMPEVKMK